MPPPNQPFYRDAHLVVDPRDRVVILNSQMLTLTRMEYRLLALLVEHAAEVVPRPILLMLTRKVDMHIKGLRRKLGAYADQYLETVFGVGYLFRPVPGAQGSGAFSWYRHRTAPAPVADRPLSSERW